MRPSGVLGSEPLSPTGPADETLLPWKDRGKASATTAERAPKRKGTPVAERLFATLHTNNGDIEVELFPNHAPKTVRNFTELAEGSGEWTDARTGQATTDR